MKQKILNDLKSMIRKKVRGPDEIKLNFAYILEARAQFDLYSKLSR